MPASTERQRRYFAMCAHSPGASKKGCPKMSKAKMREFSFKSHMPKGATLSPKGDLGRLSEAEDNSQRGFKAKGGRLNIMTYLVSMPYAPGKQGDRGPMSA